MQAWDRSALATAASSEALIFLFSPFLLPTLCW